MRMRYPPPLSEREWAWLMKRLEEGPTKEQQEMMRKAVENGRRMRVHK